MCEGKEAARTRERIIQSEQEKFIETQVDPPWIS